MITHQYPLILRKRHKWFSAYSRECYDDWHGPFNTIEQAARECIAHEGPGSIYVTQGYKLKSYEQYSSNEWEVDAPHAFQIVMPTP